MSTSAPRVIAWLLGCFLLAAVGYVLFVLSDPVGAFRNGGPFAGRVIDAETRKPIAGAFVMAGWAGTNPIHGGGCTGHAFTRTRTDGQFRIGSPGTSIHWLLHDHIAPGTLTVWMVDYRPWTIGVDAPREGNGMQASLPTGSPFALKTLGDIALAPKHGAGFSDEDRQHFGTCDTDDQFELVRSYRVNRFRWDQLCASNDAMRSATAEQWLGLADAWKHFGVPSIKLSPSMLTQLKGASAGYDTIDLLLHDHGRLKAANELTEDDRHRMCATLDVRMPELEE